jgi:hypothetical protein
MIRHNQIRETPREHFRRTVEDELSKFERRERAFRQADRDERAAKLRLPLDRQSGQRDKPKLSEAARRSNLV